MDAPKWVYGSTQRVHVHLLAVGSSCARTAFCKVWGQFGFVFAIQKKGRIELYTWEKALAIQHGHSFLVVCCRWLRRWHRTGTEALEGKAGLLADTHFEEFLCGIVSRSFLHSLEGVFFFKKYRLKKQ